MLFPVILSGGVGSRLWPVSREMYPKQFLALADSDETMLQATVGRLRGVPGQAGTIVVCNQEHRFLVAEQMRVCGGDVAGILLEPVGRNTAPAVALAALFALSKDPEAELLVLPADHVIKDAAAFQSAVEQGRALSAQGMLVTFGIVPTAPETGYGYIQRGAPLPAGQGYAIGRFVEKPDLPTAQTYVECGEYYWNSGMFLMKAATYLDELRQHAPAMVSACREAMGASQGDLDFVRVDSALFAACPSDSIDYAVMERTQRGAVVPLSAGWSDVGSWSALWEVNDLDAQGNAFAGDVVAHDVSNSYLRSDSRLLAAVGIDNLVVVETPDAVLVADKSRVQDVKVIVNKLMGAGREEATSHKTVFRPWGSYESLVSSGRFQVKRIVVNPGQKLSLQMHHHRAEHWIVVSGTAEVTCGERTFLLGEDQSTYIPLGNRHRLANPGVIPLEIIEVQSGSYLGEDDIVRFEDVYGRSPQ